MTISEPAPFPASHVQPTSACRRITTRLSCPFTLTFARHAIAPEATPRTDRLRPTCRNQHLPTSQPANPRSANPHTLPLRTPPTVTRRWNSPCTRTHELPHPALQTNASRCTVKLHTQPSGRAIPTHATIPTTISSLANPMSPHCRSDHPPPKTDHVIRPRYYTAGSRRLTPPRRPHPYDIFYRSHPICVSMKNS